MRLKSVFISQYKNLKNFTLSFDGASFIDVFVGKNGSGKSNLFEALIEIFRHLYEFDNNGEISFEYAVGGFQGSCRLKVKITPPDSS